MLASTTREKRRTTVAKRTPKRDPLWLKLHPLSCPAAKSSPKASVATQAEDDRSALLAEKAKAIETRSSLFYKTCSRSMFVTVWVWNPVLSGDPHVYVVCSCVCCVQERTCVCVCVVNVWDLTSLLKLNVKKGAATSFIDLDGEMLPDQRGKLLWVRLQHLKKKNSLDFWRTTKALNLCVSVWGVCVCQTVWEIKWQSYFLCNAKSIFALWFHPFIK